MEFKKKELEAIEPETMIKFCEILGVRTLTVHDSHFSVEKRDFVFIVPKVGTEKYNLRVLAFIKKASEVAKIPQTEIFSGLQFLKKSIAEKKL